MLGYILGLDISWAWISLEPVQYIHLACLQLDPGYLLGLNMVYSGSWYKCSGPTFTVTWVYIFTRTDFVKTCKQYNLKYTFLNFLKQIRMKLFVVTECRVFNRAHFYSSRLTRLFKDSVQNCRSSDLLTFQGIFFRFQRYKAYIFMFLTVSNNILITDIDHFRVLYFRKL